MWWGAGYRRISEKKFWNKNHLVRPVNFLNRVSPRQCVVSVAGRVGGCGGCTTKTGSCIFFDYEPKFSKFMSVVHGWKIRKDQGKLDYTGSVRGWNQRNRDLTNDYATTTLPERRSLALRISQNSLEAIRRWEIPSSSAWSFHSKIISAAPLIFKTRATPSRRLQSLGIGLLLSWSPSTPPPNRISSPWCEPIWLSSYICDSLFSLSLLLQFSRKDPARRH